MVEALFGKTMDDGAVDDKVMYDNQVTHDTR